MNFNRQIRFLSVIWITFVLSFGQLSQLSNSCESFNPVVRVDKILHGVDITKLNNPVHDVTTNFRAPLFDLTCNLNVTWSSERFNIPNRTYSVPDQVYHVFPPEEDAIKDFYLPQFTLSRDMFDVREMFLNFNKRTTTTEKTGACSRNEDYKALLSDHFGTNESFALITSAVGAYSIEFKPPSELILTDEFANWIKMLSPVKYEQNVSLYRQFVSAYGTHYVERASFGCFIVGACVSSGDYTTGFGSSCRNYPVKTTEPICIRFWE